MLTIRCTNEKKLDVSYTLLVGQTYSVGRKGGDISFPDDQSVSRNHAEIIIEHPLANVSDPLLIPMVVITDLGSKFGTFANDGISNMSPLSMREPMNLSPTDTFRFGRQWNVFKIEYTTLVVTPSTIKDVAKLKKVIMTLGGHMVNDWIPKCDFVVMESLTLTVKAVCALLSAKSIVTPSYFDDLYECVLTKKRRPEPSSFLPILGEKSLQADGLKFDPNPERSRIFEGKTFLFANQKHMKKIGIAVHCGGGKCDLVSSASNSELRKPNFIIMSPGMDPCMLDSKTKIAIELYKKAKKRLVLDSELGLAAVYISTEKHCNPMFNMQDQVFTKKLGSQTQDPTQGSSKVLVPETQPDTQLSSTGSSQFSRNIVEETFMEPSGRVKTEPVSEIILTGSTAPKRTLNGKGSEDVDVSSSKKRLAEDSMTMYSQQGSKRLRSQKRDQSGSEKALSALFGLSDSEDDDVGSRNVVPATMESQSGNHAMASLEIVPASFSVMPASPEILDISDTPENVLVSDTDSPVQKDRRTTRSRSKVESPATKPTKRGTRNSPKEPEPKTSSKRRLGSSDEQSLPESDDQSHQNLKKRKVKEEKSTTDSDELESKAKKLSIKPSTKIKKENENIEPDDDLLTPHFTIVVLSLLQKTKTRPTLVEGQEGKTVKNFKTFQKVKPNNNVNVSGTSGGSLNASKNSSLSSGKLTFELYRQAFTAEEFHMMPSRSDEEENSDIEFDEIISTNYSKGKRITGSRNRREALPPVPDSDEEIETPRPTRTRASRAAPIVKETRSSTASEMPNLFSVPDDDDNDDDDNELFRFDN